MYDTRQQRAAGMLSSSFIVYIVRCRHGGDEEVFLMRVAQQKIYPAHPIHPAYPVRALPT